MELNNKELFKQSFKMAWPAVLESFFVAMASMIDTMMVANLGTYAVASVGLTVQPKFITLAPFLATNIAVSALVARRYGQKRQDSANQILLTALLYTLLLGLIITIMSVGFADTIITWCGSNADTHESGKLYFIIIQAGMLFNILSLVINAAQRGSGNTKISMTTNVTSSIVNIIFNYLLIEGHFGFPRLEMAGAALATVLGTVVASIMSFASLFRKNSYLSFRHILQTKIKPTMEAMQSILRLGINFFIENLAMRVGFLTTAIIAANLGTDAFAAHQVGMNFLSLSFSFGDGMQVAAVALIGKSLGEKNGALAKRYGHMCQRIGLGISVVIACVMLLFGKLLFSFFFSETHILDMGVLISRFIMIITLAQISQVIFSGCLRGAGDAKYTLFVSLLSVTIIRTFITLALCGGIVDLGLTGIWIGILSDQVSRFILLYHRYHEGKWVQITI